MFFFKPLRQLKGFIRAIHYKYFAKIQFYTVQLRGALDQEQSKYFKSHFYNISNYRKFLSKDLKIENKNILEIGFGDGGHIVSLAREKNTWEQGKKVEIFGVEMDKICIYKTLKKIDENSLKNIFIFNIDARTAVENFPTKSLDEIYVLFPDPWRKRRDHKRRLVNIIFLKRLIRILKDDGQIILATDWSDYAEFIKNNLTELNKENFIWFQKVFNLEVENSNKLGGVLKTKFAQRARREGRQISIFIVAKML
jgi:tRNA (guanine-N7-)-methyltransferase